MISKLMATVFSEEVAAWDIAKTAGISLADHLVSARQEAVLWEDTLGTDPEEAVALETRRAPLETHEPAKPQALVVVEPAGCGANQRTDEQIATLATVPILTVFGDHLDAVTGTMVSWQAAYNDCQALVDRINAAGGNAEMLHPPALGIHGNSHMIMQDRNNLQIADLILQWIGRAT